MLTVTIPEGSYIFKADLIDVSIQPDQDVPDGLE
jgi:hypothetical protein